MKAKEARIISNKNKVLKEIYELITKAAENGDYYIFLKAECYPELGNGFEYKNRILSTLEKNGYEVSCEMRGRPLKFYGFRIEW